MKNKPVPISLRVGADWLDRLDAWRESQPVPPSRSDVIRVAVDRLIAAYDKPDKKQR
jgi:Arc/MetJ-type ribon-helix-helix transcriptional regulator